MLKKSTFWKKKVKEIEKFFTKHQTSNMNSKVQEFCVKSIWFLQRLSFFCFLNVFRIVSILAISHNKFDDKNIFSTDFFFNLRSQMTCANISLAMANPFHKHILCSHCIPIVTQWMSYGENPNCLCSFMVIQLHCPLVGKRWILRTGLAKESLTSLIAHLLNFLAENTERNFISSSFITCQW